MQGYYLFTILIIVTTVLIYINHKLTRLPVTIAVTLFSLLLSSVLVISHNVFPRLNEIIKENIDKIPFDEIVMNVLLGFLLFAASFKLNTMAFKRHLAVIVSLAFLSTLFSTFIVGALVYVCFHFLHFDIPFLHCLLFGALISPTDPIAALAVLGNVGIPKKAELQITGESLINDGMAIVIFTTILGVLLSGSNENFVSGTALLFLKETGGALVFGAVLGTIAFFLLKWTDNYKLEILVTLSIVTGGYTLAGMIHVSAPIAMVVTGLVCSVGDDKGRPPVSHRFVLTFWELIEEVINVVLFLLIGVGVFVIPLNKNLLVMSLVTVIVLLIARYLSLLPVYAVLRKQFEKHSLTIFTWAALRGAVSIALALSLPYSLHRTEFLAITYVVAVFSIIVQGLTIKPLVRKLGFGSG